MYDTQKPLDVSQEQMEVIEAALHTQSKILHVQAEAGGQGARDRLNEVKSLLVLLGQRKDRFVSNTPGPNAGWFNFARSLP